MRHVEDGRGVKRHLAGFRISPKDPRRMMRLAPPSGIDPETYVDVPVYDQVPIFDQGQIGNCTAQAQRQISSALVLGQTGKLVVFSAAFMYAKSRDEEGTPLDDDSGCMIPDVQAAWEKHGICPESDWPTVDDGADFAREPSDEAKTAAAKFKGLLYFHCPDHATIHAALATGFGVSIGIAVPENMMSTLCAATGEIFLPEGAERIVGGHDIVIRGYDPDRIVGGHKGAYFGPNSWSDEWGGKVNGRRGNFFLPKAFVERGLANDAESPRSISVPR